MVDKQISSLEPVDNLYAFPVRSLRLHDDRSVRWCNSDGEVYRPPHDRSARRRRPGMSGGPYYRRTRPRRTEEPHSDHAGRHDEELGGARAWAMTGRKAASDSLCSNVRFTRTWSFEARLRRLPTRAASRVERPAPTVEPNAAVNAMSGDDSGTLSGRKRHRGVGPAPRGPRLSPAVRSKRAPGSALRNRSTRRRLRPMSSIRRCCGRCGRSGTRVLSDVAALA